MGAVVLDVGSSSTRAGWAGEDGPRSVFPSAVGLSPVRDGDGDMVMGNEEKAPQADGEAEERTKTRRKRRPGVASGDVEVNSWKAGMEIKTPLKDGLGTSFISRRGKIGPRVSRLHQEPPSRSRGLGHARSALGSRVLPLAGHKPRRASAFGYRNRMELPGTTREAYGTGI